MGLVLLLLLPSCALKALGLGSSFSHLGSNKNEGGSFWLTEMQVLACKLIKEVEALWACVLSKGDDTGNVRAAGICSLPCQCGLLQEPDQLLFKLLVHLAQQRHIPEHLPLCSASVHTGKVVQQKPLCACLSPLAGTLCCFWKPGILYTQVWNCCLDF